jgi:hypothetical protein
MRAETHRALKTQSVALGVPERGTRFQLGNFASAIGYVHPVVLGHLFQQSTKAKLFPIVRPHQDSVGPPE